MFGLYMRPFILAAKCCHSIYNVKIACILRLNKTLLFGLEKKSVEFAAVCSSIVVCLFRAKLKKFTPTEEKICQFDKMGTGRTSRPFVEFSG